MPTGGDVSVESVFPLVYATSGFAVMQAGHSDSIKRRSTRRLWWLVAGLMACLNVAAWMHGQIASWAGERAIAAASRDDPAALDRWVRVSTFFSEQNVEVELALSRFARREGDLENARKHLARARIWGADADLVELEESLGQAQRGNMRVAQPKLGALLETHDLELPEIVEAYAQGYMRQREFPSAITLLSAWADDFPKDPRPLSWKGLIYAEQRLNEPAEEAFRAALALDPDHPPAALGLGQLLVDAKQPAEAIAYLRIAKDSDKVGAAAVALLARALRDTGQRDAAEQVLREASQRFPDDYRILVERADVLNEQGDYTAAIDLLRPLVEAGSKRREVRYAYAIALRGTGAAEEAAEHFAYAADAAAATGEANRKIGLVSDRPEDVELRFEIGRDHLRYGNVEDGLLWLMSVLDREPGHRATHRALAAHYAERVAAEPKFIGALQRHRALGGVRAYPPPGAIEESASASESSPTAADPAPN